MITKAIYGLTFRGLLPYMFKGRAIAPGLYHYMTDDGHDIGATAYANLAASTPDGIAREMEFVARLSTRVKKPVMHLIVSHDPEEKLSPERRIAVAARVIEKIGLGTHQALYVTHEEKKHGHTHVAVNRVGPNGAVWDMWQSAARLRQASREVEIEMGLMPHREKGFVVGPEAKLDPLSPSRWSLRERRTYEQNGVKPLRLKVEACRSERLAFAGQIRSRVSPIFEEARSWKQLHDDLEIDRFRLALFQNGGIRRGLQIISESGQDTKPSAINPKFGLRNLEKRLGPYVSPVPHLAMETHAKVLKPPARFAPDFIMSSEDRLLERYHQETELDRKARAAALQESWNLEKLAKVREHELHGKLLDRLALRGSRNPAAAVIRQGIEAQVKHEIMAIRSEYKLSRDAIRQRFQIRPWIEFLVELARRRVQDALTVLGWFRGHLHPNTHNNRLVSGTTERRPPEAPELPNAMSDENRRYFDGLPAPEQDRYRRLLDFVRREGLSGSVTSNNGVVEYRDWEKQLIFVDRGFDIIVPEKRNGYIASNFMRLAIEYGQIKWGASSAEGTEHFKDIAMGAAGRYRLYLKGRFPEDKVLGHGRRARIDKSKEHLW